MLKTRIIPTLLARGRELVKGEQFNPCRVVGNTLQAARVHNMRNVDELCILSVDGLLPIEDVKALCADTFMPVSIGGGVDTIEQFRDLLNAGADKVVLGHTDLISQASRKFGAQSVVFSLSYKLASHPTAMVPMAQHVEKLGAGEILLQSIEHDGTLRGYDLPVIKAVSSAVKIPVIASGGCGTYEHMAEALRAGAHAVAAGAMFLFTDNTPQGAAQYLHDHGFPTRLAA